MINEKNKFLANWKKLKNRKKKMKKERKMKGKMEGRLVKHMCYSRMKDSFPPQNVHVLVPGICEADSRNFTWQRRFCKCY